jgi:hypothetical protein
MDFTVTPQSQRLGLSYRVDMFSLWHVALPFPYLRRLSRLG